MYYGPVFLLWELSTPFLNIHWFMDKVNMTGTAAQRINGLLLLFSFVTSRLLYGTYQSTKILSDVWSSHGPQSLLLPKNSPSSLSEPAVPTWLAVVCTIASLVLHSLNVYWLILMIHAIRKRFRVSNRIIKGTSAIGRLDVCANNRTERK